MILHHFAQQRLALLRAMKKFLEEKMTCGRSFFAQKHKPSVFFMPLAYSKKKQYLCRRLRNRRVRLTNFKLKSYAEGTRDFRPHRP